MASRLKASKSNAISSLSLPTGDHRDRYYSLGHHDSISVGLPRNSCLRTVSNGITPSTLSLLVVDRRIQQRYKLLTEGLVQVCRVPHAKNILEKIRFSRFLRRWEDHYITLHESDIISRDVRIELTVYSHKKISLLSLWWSLDGWLHGSSNILFGDWRYLRLVQIESDRFWLSILYSNCHQWLYLLLSSKN